MYPAQGYSQGHHVSCQNLKVTNQRWEKLTKVDTKVNRNITQSLTQVKDNNNGITINRKGRQENRAPVKGQERKTKKKKIEEKRERKNQKPIGNS